VLNEITFWGVIYLIIILMLFDYEERW
jgi:hypothetical protein